MRPSLVRAAVAGGIATTVHYAMPDFISSRRTRGWTKVGVTALALAASVPEIRASWATVTEQQEQDGGTPPGEVFRSLPLRSKAVAVGSMAVVLAASAGGLVLVERWAFRHGQARAAAGKRLPHTGPALVYGALAGGLWLLPTPPPVAH